ncbi:allergen Asp f 7 homolog [Rhododendron vialii]|uniref:allergen Asp f 7 homolog n=1 Tax=Rhododendron vialii TaxID=182163 RepID=UPI00265D70B1|nr:allergen Asp f 7 homolog [Rhododendron vialii]
MEAERSHGDLGFGPVRSGGQEHEGRVEGIWSRKLSGDGVAGSNIKRRRFDLKKKKTRLVLLTFSPSRSRSKYKPVGGAPTTTSVPPPSPTTATCHHRLLPQPQLLPHRRQPPPEPASGTPTLSRTKVMVGRLGGQGSLITYGCELKSKRTGELTRFMG